MKSPALFNASKLLVKLYRKKAPEFPLFSVSPSSLPSPPSPRAFFCYPFVPFHYCCCLWLCLAWLPHMTVLYSLLFLSCFLFCFMLLSVLLFGYAPYHVLTDSKKNHNLFPIPASPLSSAVLSGSMMFPVLCVTAVHPSCFFPTLVSFNPFSFNFGSHFL